jgi:hypothetical protein
MVIHEGERRKERKKHILAENSIAASQLAKEYYAKKNLVAYTISVRSIASNDDAILQKTKVVTVV